MAMLSIPSYKNDDPNYRYKMPKLVAKVEGRGNGIRTNIVNMGEIARALKRPPDYPTKFCGHELGAQSKFDPAEGKAIVNGAHEQRDLQLLIDKFIDKFVLCQNCSLPEIDLQLKKGRVTYHCNACGDQGEVDSTHKLSTFILKNPPEVADSTMGVKKKSKEERQRDKALKSQAKKTKADGGESEGEDAEKKEKKEKKKKDKEGKEKKEKKSSKDGSKKSTKSRSETKSEDEAAEEGGEQNGATGKKAKKSKKENKNVEELDFKSSEGITATATENLVNYMTTVDESNKRSLNPTLTASDIASHLRLLQLTQGFGGRSKVFILLDVLFSADIGGELTPASLKQNSKYLVPLSQHTSARDILAAFEDFVLLRTSDGFKKYPYYLQELYSTDILSEEAILKHYESKKVEGEGRESYLKAKAAAQPFLTWLQQESDSSEEESEEAEDESSEDQKTKQKQQQKAVGVQNGQAGVKAVAAATTQAKATDVATKEDDDESDVDLDDI